MLPRLLASQLTMEQAETFYAEHLGKPFFPNLSAFMTSGDLTALILEKDEAIKSWRALMGPTNTQTAQAEAPERCALKLCVRDHAKRAAKHARLSPQVLLCIAVALQ